MGDAPGRFRRLRRRGPGPWRFGCARLLLQLGLHRPPPRRRGAARAARLHEPRSPGAMARAVGRRGDVRDRRADLRVRLLRGARPRALPVDRRRVLARLLPRGRHRHRARPALAAQARVPRDDVARRGDRRDDDRRAGGDPRLRPRPRRDRRLRLGGGDRSRLSARRPWPARARRHAARAHRLAPRPRLGAVRARAVGVGGLRHPLRTRDRARHRRAGHAARAGVAGRDAPARLRRLAAAGGVVPARRAARARVRLPRRVHAAGARHPRVRPVPRRQHPRCGARRDRDRARRRADGAVVLRQPPHAAPRAPRRAHRRADRAAEPARVHGGARGALEGGGRPSRGCSRCSTSTASSATTTPTATRRATRCCSGSPARSTTSSTGTGARSGSAATSSAC